MKTIFFKCTLLTFLILTACTKSDEESIIEESINYELKLEQSQYANLERELVGFWNTSYEEYGRETLCSCECDGVDAMRNLLIDHRPLNSNFEQMFFNDLNCNGLRGIFSAECDFENSDNYALFISNQIDNTDILSFEEKGLVNNLLTDARQGAINRNYYENAWNNLPESRLGNSISHLIIETSLSIQTYINQNGDIFGDEPQALWSHIGGAIVGSVIAVYSSAAYHGVLSGEDIVDTAIVGAIGGAIRSF